MSTTRGPVFVESVNVDAAWEVYYQLADRRHKDGLTYEELRQVIEAALVGKVEAEEEETGKMFPDPDRKGILVYRSTHRRWLSPWVEVEEYQ